MTSVTSTSSATNDPRGGACPGPEKALPIIGQTPTPESISGNETLQPDRAYEGDPLDGLPQVTVASLYLHVPFCFHKCHYCDFYSLVDRPGQDRQPAFTDALIAEVRRRSRQVTLAPRTIFVGGGTPTLLAPPLWRKLLGCFDEIGLLKHALEVTVEANPETVTGELAEVLAAGGINRVSLGAQSFDPRHLKTLERWHDPASVSRAMQAFRSAGITNLNLDLIFATPGQTLDDLDRDLDAALTLEPDHLSCYSLIFEPGTPLTKKRDLGRIACAEESLEAALYRRVIERLADAGYEHYEISNWARSGRRCAHNLAYWHNHHWLGCGPSAASHVAGRRWKNVPHLARYLAGSPTPPVQDVEQLDADAAVGEALMLRLRLLEGAPLDWLNPLLQDDADRQAEIDHLVDLQVLERTASHLRLTPRGLMVADSVIARLL